MRASDAAVASASAFLGRDVAELQPRLALDAAGSVPQSDDGLRLLAANGDWASVIPLADRLGDEAAARVRQHSNRATLPSDTTKVPSSSSSSSAAGLLSAQAASLAARLPYLLVQVTAYFKMQRIGAAKKLLETIGDPEEESFRYPGTSESFAPFSLRFVAALMPFYLGAPMEAQRTLYSQLDECVAKGRRRLNTGGGGSGRRASTAAAAPAAGDDAYCSPSSTVGGTVPSALVWAQREARVRRALIYLHFTAGQYAAAVGHFGDLIATTFLSSLTNSTGAGAAEAASARERVCRVLLLQQLACLCLHCGELVRSQELFGRVGAMAASAAAAATPPTTTTTATTATTAAAGQEGSIGSSSSSSSSGSGGSGGGSGGEAATLEHIARLNDAFLLAFRGDFTGAAAAFRAIVSSADRAVAGVDRDTGGSGDDPDDDNNGLFHSVLRHVQTNAAISELTCQPYCASAAADPHTAMAGLIASMEERLRRAPRVLACSDVFVADMVRLYTLAGGNRKAKLEELASVLEVFRCDAASLPNLEKMV